MSSDPIALDLHDVGLRWSRINKARGREARGREARGREARAHADLIVVSEPSPGQALYRKGRLDLGAHARAVARLYPKDLFDSFWQRLSTDPLAPPFPSEWTHADLAHAQLELLWHEAIEGGMGRALDDETGPAMSPEAILAVAGGWSEEQLGLLLGIVRSLDIPIAGVVDGPLAAVRGSRLRLPAHLRRLVHLDLYQHRAVASVFELEPLGAGAEGEHWRIRLADRSVAESAGLESFHRRWVDHVAEIFVRTTRFDPRHRGDREQQLYDHLPAWLEALAEADATVAVLPVGELAEAGPSVELDRDGLLAAVGSELGALEALLAPLLPSGRGRAENTRLLLSASAASIPGLVPHLAARLGAPLALASLHLDAEAVARGALALADPLAAEPSDLPYLLSCDLPGSLFEAGPPPVSTSTAESTADSVESPAAWPTTTVGGPSPTHVLWQGHAHALGSTPLAVGLGPHEGRGLVLDPGPGSRDGSSEGIARHHLDLERVDGVAWVENHSPRGTWLDGVRIDSRARLSVGSRLRIGSPGVELLLIRVVEEP